ncbi:MAG: IPT/TIG domain-containing protein, partial [Dehalococcoidia bacterium]
AAYVFARTGTTWAQQAYLKASLTGIGDQFGIGVGIAGDVIVVGSPAEDSSSPGVNGVEADAGAPNSGAAYVFARTGSTWVQHAYLKANNPDTSDRLGHTVAIGGDTVIAGAPFEDSVATGVGGAPFNNLAADSGASYIFVMDVPTVTGVGPASGDIAGGTSVTITGTKFTATPGVLIGGTAATNVTWVNATTLTATTPAGVAGAASVVVTNPDGLPGTGLGLFSYAAPAPQDEDPGPGPFLPTVSTLDPVAVSETGAGLSATVLGADEATAVFFEVSRSPLFADSVIHLPEQVTRTALGLTVATLNLDALLPGTTYFVRATAMTPSGPVSGAARTLTTKPAAQPALTPVAPPAAPAPTTGALAAPPVFSDGGQAQSVFTGGTVGQLEQAVIEAGAAGAWLQDGEGAFVLFIVGGGAVNGPFTSAFPEGFPAAVPLVLVAP